MPTKLPRLNVVLDPNAYKAIERLAKKGGSSLSLIARDLICDALEIYEDGFWAAEAAKRDKPGKNQKWISHKQAWV
jgi:predicted DNA-binding protein